MPRSETSTSIAHLKENLRRRNLKWNWDEIAANCLANPRLLPKLLECCTDAEVPVQQNAGAVLGKIIDLDQEILIPHLPKLLENLKADPHDAVKRATMRVLQIIDIPEELEGEVFDVAMQYVADYAQPIAIRAFSMTTARRLCERYPALRDEVLPIVKDLLARKPSPGIISRAKRERKLLEALEDHEGNT